MNTWVSNSSAYETQNQPEQLYRVTHTGGKTEVKVDHRKVGKGWVYLGTYHFDAGTAGYLEISNKSGASGRAVADGVRFGNGVGDITRGGAVSGQSREDEASLYWIQSQASRTYEVINNGAATLLPASTYRGSNTTDDNANVGAPPRWSTYMNNSAFGVMNDRLFLSYHSNAGGGRGTVGLVNGNNSPGSKTPFQREWALYAAREVNDDLVALSGQLESPWFNRTGNSLLYDSPDFEFGEMNNSVINNEFDATILEVAFHDNALDAALMRDPKVRQWIARSSVQAAVRYFDNPDMVGTPGVVTFAPDAPTNVRAITLPNGDVTIRWTPPAVSNGTGAAASGYVIESSANGYGFDGGIIVAGGGSNTFTIPAGQIGTTDATYFRVVSTNAGGWSVPGEVVGARALGAGATARVLIVNGFDRFDKSLDPKQNAPISGPGTSAILDRVRPRSSNAFDYVIQAGEAIEAYATPVGFDSAQNEAVINGDVDLSDYNTVVWLSGEESTANDSFNPTEQALVSSYVNGGGHFFVSGSEIAWDLGAQGGGAALLNGTLRATYVGDDAGTYNATGAAGSIFAGISLSFDNGAQFYDADFPDRLNITGGSTVAMTYAGGLGGNAGVQYTGANGEKVVYLAFPFEVITTAANRGAVMAAVLTYFNTAVDPSPATAAPAVGPGFDTRGL